MPRIAQFTGRAAARRSAARALVVAALVFSGGLPAFSGPALAQPTVAGPADAAPDSVKPAGAPELSKAVQRLLAADYLSDAERRDLRVFHGIWEDADLDTPARAARASLILGDIDSVALKVDVAPPLDRAEAAVLRGEYQGAIAILDVLPADDHTEQFRRARIHADALMALGRVDEAARIADAATQLFAAGGDHQPGDVVETMRLYALLTRLRGPAVPGSGGEFHVMMGALDKTLNTVDKLHWPTLLAQAELLYEKDNAPEAASALQTLLTLNPSCASAWALLGRMSVDSFNFAMTEAVARRLDLLASGRTGASEDEQPGGTGGVSVWAAEIRARAALRQSDPDAADAALTPALERFPRQRELLALKSASIALRYDAAALERALAEFDMLSPGSPLAALEVGKALGEARQYEPASRYLTLAHDRQPQWPEPVIELGLLEVQYGRIERARDALAQATALDPFNVRADNSLRLVKELLTYDSAESPHFTVRYKPGVDAVLAREMLAPMERNYRIVTGAETGGIDYEPAMHTFIDLMPDHKWFGVRIAGMPAIHTIAAATGSCIAMEVPREGRNHYGTYDWVRVLRHEFTHTVTLARTNNRIPHWFTEASAVYLEQAPRDYSTCRLLADALESGALFDFSEINIAFVRPRRATDRQQAYAQGHWMYEFIIQQWGDKAPLELMDRYAQGVREEAAFKDVLGVSRDEFLQRFKVWAKGQVISWGLALKEGVPSVSELLVQEAANDPAHPGELKNALDGLAEQAGMAAVGGGGPAGDKFQLDVPDVTPPMVSGWLEKYPDHPDVLQLAVQEQMHDIEGPAGAGVKGGKSVSADAAPLLERYAAARPVDPLPHQLLADLYLKGNQPQEAIPHLEYLDAREQYQPIYAAELARQYAAVKDWDHAWAKAERATEIAPYDAALRELAASIAIKRGDLDNAERHVRALMAIEPDVARHAQRLEAIQRLRRTPSP